jgi:HD-GYP domain-containing protein (c-di-GMP phosphodiesterase class II)
MGMAGLPRKAWVFLAFVAIAALVATRLLMHFYGAPLAFIGFGVLFFLAELFPVRRQNSAYSVSHIVAVAALIALGPAAAAIASSFGGLVNFALHSRKDWLSRVTFNAGQFALTTALSGAAYVAVGGPVGSLRSGDFPRVILALGLAALVSFVVNALLVATMISLARSQPIMEALNVNFAPIIGSTFAFSLAGLLFAVIYFQVGIWAPLFVLVPLLVARRVLQAAAEMDGAYEATLRGLVTAIEAKDAYTRGHAERVSKLTTMIARELGFDEKRVRSVRIAALMHDVGKLVVSTAILTKPGKLTDEEYEHMKWHPIFGCEVIEEIDFLRDGEAVNAVRHHHERLDGRGYPDNLYGDDVPLTARVVMVADAFDSMTSTRTYRFAKNVDDGLRELRRCAATQFDPLCISALDRAIHKHGWEPTPELYGGEQTERPAVSVHAKHA